MSYSIFANHAHVFPEKLRPEATIDKLRELMEECGIEKAVCFAPFEGNYKFRGLEAEHNSFLAEAVAGDDRLVGFGTLDFDLEDMDAQVSEIIGYGFKGIKIHPAYQEINIMCEKARRVYELAEEHGLFISFHTGIHWHRISDYNMLLFDEVAYNYPKLQFSMEHFGGYHFFREALAVMVNNKRRDPRNVYAGWTSMAMNENGLADSWSHTDTELRTLLHQTGADIHIFGLDFPYNGIPETRAAIERIKSLETDEQTKQAILGGNLARALGMEL